MSLRTSLTDSNKAEYIDYPGDSRKRYEPGFALGGPIMKDKMWFFGAYQPAITNYDRHVDASTAQNPKATASDTSQKQQVQYITANQTSQIGNNIRTRVAYNNSWSKQEGLLASLNGLDTPGTNYTKGTKFPNWVLSGDMNWVLSPKFVVGVRGGYRKQDTNDFNVPNEPRFTWFPTTNNVNYLDVPANLQHGTGFTSVLSNTAVSFDTLTRAYFHADGTSYFHAGGEHQVKFGVQYDRVGENIQSGELRPRVTLNFGIQTNPGFGRGKYGYYSVRSQTADPNAGFITQGNVHRTTSACSSRTPGRSTTS